MFSTSKHERDIVTSYERGANSFVHKPSSYPDYHGLFDRLGRYWFELNEPPPQQLPA